MPNARNIEAPIILIGAGRSGTSLISKIFDLHPDCVSVGETANLIFGPWQAVALSSASIRPLVEHDLWVSDDERAARVVRQTFLTCFPDETAHWMQKPIGVPKAIADRFEDGASADAAAWYWRVMRTAFPRARYLAVLRHPCDVVLSGRSRWGFADRSLWRTMGTLAQYLLHPDSPVSCIVRYEDLVASPEPTVRRLTEAAGLDFRHEMLAGFDEVHVPAPGRENPSTTGYSRRDDWASLDATQITADQHAAITAAFARFGGGLEWPPHLEAAVAGPPADTPAPEALEVQRLRAQVAQLSRSVERALFERAEELRRRDEAWQQREHEFMAREQEATRLWREQQEWIAELERVKAWFQEQLDYWRDEARRRS